MKVTTDVIIIGSGVAALQAAKFIGRQMSVHILTKSEVTSSSSYYAQGGIAVVMDENDHIETHIQDTLEAGVHHHHLKVVDSLVKDGKESVHALIKEGLPVDRNIDGTIKLGMEGAHSSHRIVHSGGDASGRALVDHLLLQLPPRVTIHDYELAYELIVNIEGRCIGVKTKSTDGQITTFFASHIVIASGGAGALYPITSNRPNNLGDGIALAYRAGAAVADMEFVQFHPSLLFVNGEAKGLVSEAVRGEGGIFVDEQNHPIMHGLHPLSDLAPRHITAYEMYKRRAMGKQVFLDVSAIEHFEIKFPTITALCREHHISIQKGYIPIAPGSHFLMGGVVADSCGRTSIPGLYAVGEVACTGVHGANRLASNSLLEGITFGKNMASYICEQGPVKYSTKVLTNTEPLANRWPYSEKHQLRQDMMAYAGIVRDGETLSLLAQKLSFVDQTLHQSLDLMTIDETELYFMHIVASLIARSALMRTESRGAHIRTDFKEINPEWAERWILIQQGNVYIRSELHEPHQTGVYA
ncbi:L-aspartate oxidase [Psychrobacillus sp. NPDC058041]|uniref:L-aspartate oxidase n=1 Tax=Psychrobacillus sp. NPDC058041 TaxID=3346310 RepID=UPI0036DBC636